MFFRAKRRIARFWFNWNCRSIFNTSPIHPNDDSLTVVSMLGHDEMVMYLIAVKSFCKQLGRVPKVVVLSDGSLTQVECSTLQAHISGVRIVPIASVATDRCPKGSCWERLLLISDIVQDSYVVQLDSDTLTLRPIVDVVRCIEANCSFTLMGDRSYPAIESMASACSRAKENNSSMVQVVCERSFDKLDEVNSLKYVRGNAGFVGFAKGSVDREKIVRFSDLMRQLAGEKWDDWGSEQVTSNLLIANSPDAFPLPFPAYLSYWAHPDVVYRDASFIHFIGPHRFSNGFYLESARKAIGNLTRGQ